MKKFSIFILLFIFSLLLHARDNGRFRHFTTEDGLSQNSVFAIAQDQQGFIWVGTADGLCRYDGYHFTVFRPDPKDSSSISNNLIRCLHVDKKGNVWVGTRDGLNRYDPISGKFRRFYAKKNDKTSLSENIVLCLGEDLDGKIYAGTSTQGVCVYDYATDKFFQLRHSDQNPTSICGDDVRGFACDKQGHIWMATWDCGVCDYNPANGKCVTFTDHSGPGLLNYSKTRGAICVDDQNRIWIGTWTHGIDVWDPAKQKMFYETDSTTDLPNLGSALVWSIMKDATGKMWIATAENGLIVYDPSTHTKRNFMPDENDPWSINDNNVWSLMQDRSGQIWLGTWQGGVNVFDERLERFNLFRVDPKDKNSLPSNTIWSMCGDGKNGLWIGTAKGPVHYDPATKIFDFPPTNAEDKNAPTDRSNIQTLCRDKKGNIWMGTAGGGLHCYDPVSKKYRLYNVEFNNGNGLASNTVNLLACDENGNVWIGAGYSAIQKYDAASDKFITYSYSDADSVSSTTAINWITPDGNGEVLIGLLSGDLLQLEPSTGKYHKVWKNISTLAVNVVQRDEFGGLWIGTSGSGIIYFKDGKSSYFSEKNGLPNDNVNGIVSGAHGELWLSTNNGLCRFDPVARDVRTYNTQDGLQGIEFNQGAFYKTPDGKIWFGGVKGISAFYPSDIQPNQTPSPAVITAFSVLNKPFPLTSDISGTKEITLSYRDYFFSFDFTGLEFSNPSRNHYRYMMEGFDNDWVEAGSRRFATFTNLDPGEYTFRVMASNNDGYWGGTQAEIHIIITPPFWKTKWFYTLCILVVLFSVYGFIRVRERNLRKEKVILETKVTERTFELNREKEKVTAAHKDIRDSINYAQRIQYALLAQKKLLQKNIPEHFILFKPKDVVSGDFYWATETVGSRQSADGRQLTTDKFYLAVCDSTGHGVPGAFMSLLNISFLNEAIIEKKMEKPGEVFDYVRKRLIENISQEGGQDGMDAILICIDKVKNEITYSAANNSPVIVHNGEVNNLVCDKMPVGKGEKNISFQQHEIQFQKGDMIYLYTDGFADQFGGPNGKKFKETNLKKLLVSIADLAVDKQSEKLNEVFENWKGELEQVDDVCLIGIRIS